MITSLADVLERSEGPGICTFYLSDGPVRLDRFGLLEQAQRAAERLAELGVRRGDRVGILGPNRPEWVVWAYAAWRAGAILVPLPFHLFIRSQEAFARNIASLTSNAGCKLVAVAPQFRDAVPAALAMDWAIPERGEPSARLEPPDPNDDAVIQYTSGSTADPKGVILTHRSILAALRMSGEAGEIKPGIDRYLGWLPFFHDWGLFGYVVRPLVHSCEAHLLPTERFARNPREWFKVVTQSKATITSGPSSAYAVAWRALARNPDGIDLSSLRICEHAAETIDPDVLDMAESIGGPLGLDPGSLAGAFGLAEVTLGIAGTDPGKRCPVDEVDPDDLRRGLATPASGSSARRIASCGSPHTGVKCRVVDDGVELPERRVGEFQLQSPSMMRGYWGSDEQPFDEGWLKTGDLGYLADGHMYFVSRSKDIVVAFGRNYAPDDFEWAARGVNGVRTGRAAAFADPSGEDRVLVTVERDRDTVVPDELAASVLRAVHDEVGLRPYAVLVVSKGTITKTTSGKPQRSKLREAYASGSLEAAVLGSASGVTGQGEADF